MTDVGTSAFDVKDQLLSLLQNADPALLDVMTGEIWYAFENTNKPSELIWLGEIAWQYERAATLGALSREEEFMVVLTIEVHRPGDTQKQANDRAHEILQAIQSLLRDPRCLGLPNLLSVGVEPHLTGEGQDPEGRGALVITRVRVRARK